MAPALRLWSLDHGLPYSYNLDERAHFVPHAVAMTGGDLNPGYFINPPPLTYLLAAYLSLIHLGGVEQWFADDPTAVFTAARLVAVVFGVGDGRGHLRRRARLVRPQRRPGGGGDHGRRVPAGLLLAARAQRRARRAAVRAGAVVLGDRAAGPGAQGAAGRRRGAWAPAASFKYSDGAIVIALVAAAFLSPALSFKAGVEGPGRSPG